MRQAAKTTLMLLLLIWIVGILAAYFVVHRPWPGAAPTELGKSILSLALASALALLAAAVGRVIVRDPSDLDPLERLALSTAIGVGVLGLAILIVGLLGLLSVWIAWAALVVGLVIVRRQAAESLNDLHSIADGLSAVGWLPKSAAALAAFLAAIGLLQALAPPLKWDSLVYHLELPRLYLQSGRIGFVEDNLYVGFPQLTEMNLTWAMALMDGSTAATLGWLVGSVGFLGAAGFARRLFGARGAYLLFAVLMSGASLWQGLSWGYVDHWVLLYGSGVLIALDRYSRGGGRRWILIAAACTGFALGTKYSSAVMIFFGSVWLAASWWQGRPSSSNQNLSGEQLDERTLSFGDLIRDLVLFGAVSLIVALPWFVKNASLTGNPIHPFLVPGREVDSLRQSYHGQSPPQKTLVNQTLLPIRATVLGIEGGPEFNTSISPLLIMLIPGSLLVFRPENDRHRNTVVRLMILGLAVWFAWAVGSQIANPLTRSRHYYGAMPALAVLAVAGYEYLSGLKLKQLNVGWIVSGLVAFSLLLTAIGAFFHLSQINPLPVLSGRQDRFDYLAEQLGWYGWAMEGVNDLHPDSKVKFLWEPRSYYCQVDCRPDAILDQWWHARRLIGEAPEIAEAWRDQGFTHVLIYDFGAELEFENQPLLSDEDRLELERLQAGQLELAVDFGNVYSLYTLGS